MDKLLNDIQLEFRDKYKDDLEAGVIRNYEFNEDFNRLLKEAELRSKLESQAPTRMRTFEESKKSQKTVASLKIDKNEKNKESAKNTKKGGSKNKKQEAMEEGNDYIEDITVPLKSKLPPSCETRLERNEMSLERNETSLVARECTGSCNRFLMRNIYHTKHLSDPREKREMSREK